MIRNEGDRLKRVIICSPGDEYAGVADAAAHNFGAAIDRDAASRQHRELRKRFESFGCTVIDCPELAGHPQSVITRDTAVCAPSGFVQPRMG